MTTELTPIDIARIPEIAALVDEVQASGAPRRITRDNQDIAVLMPVRVNAPRRRRARPSQADIDAAIATAGAWRGLVDADQRKRELKAARSDHRLRLRR